MCRIVIQVIQDLLRFSVMCSGDLWSYNAEKDVYVVSPKPDVTVVDIDEHHMFIILATDGLWQVVEPAQAVDIVAHLTANMVMLFIFKSSRYSKPANLNNVWILLNMNIHILLINLVFLSKGK